VRFLCDRKKLPGSPRSFKPTQHHKEQNPRRPRLQRKLFMRAASQNGASVCGRVVLAEAWAVMFSGRQESSCSNRKSARGSPPILSLCGEGRSRYGGSEPQRVGKQAVHGAYQVGRAPIAPASGEGGIPVRPGWRDFVWLRSIARIAQNQPRQRGGKPCMRRNGPPWSAPAASSRGSAAACFAATMAIRKESCGGRESSFTNGRDLLAPSGNDLLETDARRRSSKIRVWDPRGEVILHDQGTDFGSSLQCMTASVPAALSRARAGWSSPRGKQLVK